jgi:hypothetical protein
MKSGRWVPASFAVIAISLTFGTGLARGETTGDLYIASADGILEVVTASSSVLDTVSVPAGLGPIAIRPDGRELCALSGGRGIVRLDLESMAVTSHIVLPAPGAAIAYPRGEQLVAALPSLRRLAILDTGTGTLSRSEPLPGAVNLLSGDRRDGRVVAAARGEGWVAVLDPGTASVRSTTIAGNVVAVAFDGTAGIVVVATTAPNRLVGLDLRDFATAWSTPLSAAPSAIAMTTDRVFVDVGRTLWALDRVASPGWPFTDVSSSQPTARRWASLAKPTTALAMSDDGTFLYALETDRVEGFAVQLSAADMSAAASATRTVLLAGSKAPLALVAVPGAKPFLGGPGADPQSGVPTASAAGPAPGGGTSPAPGGGTPSNPPHTDTVRDDAGRWVDARQALPGALLVGIAILVMGLLAIRWYERSGEA